MKIIKTENKPKEVTPFREGLNTIVSKFKQNTRRNVIIACSLLLLGGAIWLNIAIFSDSGSGDYNTDKYIESGENNSNTAGSVSDNNDDSDSYFAMAAIDRTRARDEALEVLYTITSSDDATDEAKEEAYTAIARLSALIEEEANIETLVKSKGFSECVAVLDEDKANIVVMSEGLNDSEIAQILSIVYEQSGILPANVTIIEK